MQIELWGFYGNWNVWGEQIVCGEVCRGRIRGKRQVKCPDTHAGHDYKSPRAAVMICATMVNTYCTHRNSF